MTEAAASPRASGRSDAWTSGLATIVITQGLRYWLLGAWALLLGVSRGPVAAGVWFVGCCLIGLVRGRIERALVRREGLTVGAELTAIATVTSVAWAVAPLLAWTAHGPWSLLATTTFLCSGGLLVTTQFRHLPRRAVVVASPYMAVLAYVALDAAGEPALLPLLATGAVAGSALVTNVLFGSVHKAQIDAFQAEQARLISELEDARDAAHAASQAKSAFLATISHELRTPMNGVLGAAHLLARGPLDPEARDLVDVIRQSGGGLARLLDDILDFAKIEEGRLEIAPSDTDLHGLAKRVVTLWSGRALEKGLTLTLAIDEDVPVWVRLDAVRLGQVLHNLLSNAVKFTEYGAISVNVTVKLESERLRIAVQDDGPGIGVTDRDRLFKAFSQIDASSTRRHGGAGLGLAISRRIANLLGGDLWLAQGGQGACFVLDLPITTTAAPILAVNDQDDGPSKAAPLDVLVVEDHPVNRRLLETWLTSLGHACQTAHDGQQALDAIRAGSFDLILMDVNMPVMDGLTAVRTLRAQGAATPIFMLSASAAPADQAAGFSAGANGYLAKPLDFAQLHNVLVDIGQACADGRDQAHGVALAARS
jgi:signal transduction histidine kinase/ActR/RegA family two-component response regulator